MTYQKARFHNSCSTVGVVVYSFFRCAPASCAIRMPKLRIVSVPCGEFVAFKYAAISCDKISAQNPRPEPFDRGMGEHSWEEDIPRTLGRHTAAAAP